MHGLFITLLSITFFLLLCDLQVQGIAHCFVYNSILTFFNLILTKKQR